jgi:hypothetical protein
VCWFLGLVALQWLHGHGQLGSVSETCAGSRVGLVGVFISFKKNFYRLPFTRPSLVRRIDPSMHPQPGRPIVGLAEN